MEDAADGVMHQPPANEETVKILKKLGYPEIQEATRPSCLLSKALAACQRRLKKLEELMPINVNLADYEAPTDATASQTLHDRPLDQTYICSALNQSLANTTPNPNIYSLRMMAKVVKMYRVIDDCCDRLTQLHTDGVADGFSEE